MKKLLVTVVFLVTVGAFAQSQLDNFVVYNLDTEGYDEFSEQMVTQRDSSTGLSFGRELRNQEEGSNAVTSTENTQEPIQGSTNPSTELDSIPFYLGQYVVMCFTPRQDLYVRLLDTQPSGKTTQLYPVPENGSVKVVKDTTYCAGDENSDVFLYADEASGIGKGVLYLLGAEKESDLPSNGELENIAKTPVGQTQSSLGWGRQMRPSGSATTEVNGVDLQEAYFRYEILEPGR